VIESVLSILEARACERWWRLHCLAAELVTPERFRSVRPACTCPAGEALGDRQGPLHSRWCTCWTHRRDRLTCWTSG
jgi:hypothetical protein